MPLLRLMGLTLALILASAVMSPAHAEAGPVDLIDPPLQQQLLASASPDECFGGIGVDYEPLQTAPDGSVSCPGGQQLKVNQAYVWGMANWQGRLWFGTGPNINCLAGSQFIGPMSSLTDSYVCEGPDAANLERPFFADLKDELLDRGLTPEQADDMIRRLGDWRAPDLFTYDLTSGALVSIDDQVTGEGARLLARTVGIRSAGAIGHTVIFAGPDIASEPNGRFGAVNFFVFQDGQYLGAKSVEGWTNIRKWVEINGALYTGVATVARAGSPVRGEVLRFIGSDGEDVLQTDVVGEMTTAPSEFTEHNGRVYTSTWPVGPDSAPAGIWMSPELGADGLGVADAAAWEPVWDISDYEPDPLIRKSTAIGPVESLDGRLFWGTMNIPFVGAAQHVEAYYDAYGQRPKPTEIVAMLVGAHRATSVFRAADLAADPAQVDLLYGSPKLPMATYAQSKPPIGSPVTWRLVDNRMGGTSPLYGPAGFGNPFNGYTWTMAVNRGDLYVGTFDYSYLLASMVRGLVADSTPTMLTGETLRGMLDGLAVDDDDLGLQYGADLYRFRDGDSRAVEVFNDGAGNRYNYGIRTIVNGGEQGLYLGMANPMNLEVNPPGEPQGGWQLLRLGPLSTTTQVTAGRNPALRGLPVRLQARVEAPTGRPSGMVTFFDGAKELGACRVTRLSDDCSILAVGLSSGVHEITARYGGVHSFAASTSGVLRLVVNGISLPQPTLPAPAGPTSAPTAAPAVPTQISARSARKAVPATRNTVLVRSAASSSKVSWRCKVNGSVRTGKAARKACGVKWTVSSGVMRVAAQPTCRASRVWITMLSDGRTWSRSWSVSRAQCRR